MTGFEYIVNAKGISFTDVAEMLHISPKTVNDWVKKRRSIPKKHIRTLSEKLSVPEKYITMILTENELMDMLFERTNL